MKINTVKLLFKSPFLLQYYLCFFFAGLIPHINGMSQVYNNVGYTVVDFTYNDNGQNKTISTAVWYPTEETPVNWQYGGPTWGRISPDAEPLKAEGCFPLLVFSHGFSGCGLASVFFTETLASKGWIVACPDHHDSYSFARIRTGSVKNVDRKGALNAAKEISLTTPETRGKYRFRPAELAAVINSMISSPMFSGLIDTNRIAAGGHSFGGFTSLALCGTIPEFYDPRIKAILMFSTGAAGYLFADEELAKVRIPSMLFMGSRERNQLRGEKKMKELSEKIFTNMPAPKYYLEIRGANHFSFNIRLSSGFGTRILSGSKKDFDVITRYSVAFLEKYVSCIEGQDEILEKKDPMLTVKKIMAGH